MGKRHVIVVGGGVIGMAAAYELARRGHRTTLLEARDGVALETSYANGALLTPAMSDPWNAPGVHRHLLASLFDSGSAMKLRLSAVPSLLGWGVQFFRNSRIERHVAATRASFVLARYSLACMRELRTGLALDYDLATSGTIKLFRDGPSMAGPLALAQELAPLGLRFELLDRDATVKKEPALAGIRDQIAGAIYFPDDELGDPLKFCRALVSPLRSMGGTVRTGVCVSRLSLAGGAVVGVESSAGPMRADAVVIAAGNATARLVRGLGVALPIKPAKGYTVTFDVAGLERPPLMPVVDDALHAALVPIGGRLRVAGTAEFAGEDLRVHPLRIEALLKLLAAVYPQLAARVDRADAQLWTGLRPMSADGLPFIGSTRVRGLYISAGHGHLGWTLATGSAHLLADLMMGVSPQVDPLPYRATR